MFGREKTLLFCFFAILRGYLGFRSYNEAFLLFYYGYYFMTEKTEICWQDIPFVPRRFPFFYGWVVIATSVLGVIASIPGQTMGVSVFTDSLIDALGLTREQLSRCYMFGTIISGLLLPFAGRLIDKLGTRIMSVVAAAGLGVSLVFLSRCDSISNWLGQYISNSITVALFVIMLCFMLIRFFGQGTLTVTSRVAMGKWFNHRRGLATGIAGIFIAFAFSYAPKLFNWMLESFGWRSSSLILSGIVMFGYGTFAAVFMRDNPEECLLVMDGVTDEAKLAKMSDKVPDTYHQFTRKEAVNTMAFWSFTLGTALHVFLLTAITFHLTSIAEEASRTRKEAFGIFIAMSFAGVAARFTAGYLSDLIRIKWLLIVMMTAELAGTFGMVIFASRSGWWMASLGYGIAGGIFGTLINVAWPRFFGRENLGGIAGINMSILVFASAIGPWLYSMVLVKSGSFRPIIATSLLLPILITVLAFWTENPQEKFAPQ